jgi:hypothetical protein
MAERNIDFPTFLDVENFTKEIMTPGHKIYTCRKNAFVSKNDNI